MTPKENIGFQVHEARKAGMIPQLHHGGSSVDSMVNI